MIDDNSHIGYGSIVSAKNRIHIERNVIIAQSVLIIDHNHLYEDIDYQSRSRGLTKAAESELAKDLGSGTGLPSYAQEDS